MAGVMANALKYQAFNQAVQSGHTIKVAFFSVALDATVPAYGSGAAGANEVTQPSATPPINTGGLTLANRQISASDGSVATATLDWDNPTFTPSSQFSYRSILVYNDSTTPKYALYVEDYGTTQVCNAGTLYTLDLGSGSTLLRFA